MVITSQSCNKNVVKASRQLLKLSRLNVTPDEYPFICRIQRNRPCQNHLQAEVVYTQDDGIYTQDQGYYTPEEDFYIQDDVTTEFHPISSPLDSISDEVTTKFHPISSPPDSIPDEDTTDEVPDTDPDDVYMQKNIPVRLIVHNDANIAITNWMNAQLKKILDNAKENVQSRNDNSRYLVYISENDLIFPDDL